VRWLHVAIAATTARLGPTVVPGHTACYVCLDRRLRSNGRDLDGLDAFRAEAPEPPDEGMVEPFRAAVAAQAALEAARLLTGFSPPVTIGRSVELDSRTPTASAEDVLRVPRCPACSRRAPKAEVWDRTLARLEGRR
jgi:bacteriocin biosynthesis cyclodehydratase domain-containing protein